MHENRRSFLKSTAALAVMPMNAIEKAGRARVGGPAEWRTYFPALDQQVNGNPLVYLDTAATSQRPTPVIDAVADFYRRDNANPGRTLHALARRADNEYEEARRTAARFINARDPLEVVFTRGTTEGINLVASAWGSANLRRGDEVLLTISEHASNMLPWQLAAKRAGATVKYVAIDDEGNVDADDLTRQLSIRTKVFAFMHVSNVLGRINPAKELCARARQAGAMVMIDGAQSVPHFKVDVQDIGCDFLAFSGHKMMGPMGVGVLWGRRELLDAMPAYQAGSNMAHEISTDSAQYSEGALKFGAGTPNVAGSVGLAAAMKFIDQIGWDSIIEHEQMLSRYTLETLARIPGLRVIGPRTAANRISVFSFVIEGISPQDVITQLDAKGIAIRGGDLASLPLLERFGIKRAARASLYLYTSREDVDRLATALLEISRAKK